MNKGQRFEKRVAEYLNGTLYPHADGAVCGDVVAEEIHYQCKMADGSMTLYWEVENHLDAFRKVLDRDFSSIWAIGFTEDDFILIPKEELFQIVAKDPLRMLRFNHKSEKDGGEKVLRLKLGIQKYKYFMEYPLRKLED